MKQKNSLKDIVYNRILEGIFTDEYKPNQILNEKELVEKFGYSKSPIREALLTLCNEGVLRSFPRYGYEVVRLTREDVEHILQFRKILEGGVLRNCCNAITADQLQRLKESDDRCKHNADDIWTHWDANTKFHMLLLSFGNNPYASQMLEHSMNILKRAYAQFYWQIWKQVEPSHDTRQHSKIIECIEHRNVEQASFYLEEDLKDFCF